MMSEGTPNPNPKPLEAPIDSKQLADVILHAALEKKAFEPVILDVVELVKYCDYFVIVSARNPRQVRAIADEVRHVLKKDYSLLPISVEGAAGGNWLLVDFDDVVLHVFQESARVFYDLEGLWRDAPRLPVPEVAAVDEDRPLFSLP